jgi:pimeloyl-ACP methyl ester carboxylesterase
LAISTEHALEVDGLRIAYKRAGEGPPLILLHGFFGDSRVWRRQLEDLSNEFDVVAWDTPGCGRSSDPPDSVRIPEYAGCLSAFVDALGLERPHVLGLSFGSTLALELYRQRPTLCKTLVLASAYAGWSGSLPTDVVEQRLRKTITDLDLPAAQVVSIYNVPGLLSESAPQTLVDENAAIMSGFHRRGMKAMTRALAEADLRSMLADIKVPTLLLYGDKDVRSPVSLGQDLHSRIPGSQLVVIPAIGHLSNLEAADRFNDEVRKFLRSAQ